MVRRRQIPPHPHVFLHHSPLLLSRFPNLTPSPPPPRHFHRIPRFSPRRRRQRSRRSPPLFPLFRRLLQRRHRRCHRRLHCFISSFSLPIQNLSLSPSSPRDFPSLIPFPFPQFNSEGQEGVPLMSK